MAIPSIIGQLAQIFIGSALAPFVARKVKALMSSQKDDDLLVVRAASVHNAQDLHDESFSNSTEGAHGDSAVLGSPYTLTVSLQR